MIIDRTHATTLNALADRVARLAPCHRDPFRFHEEKSELVAELRRLAQSKQIVSIEDRKGAYGHAANDNHPRRTAV